MAEKKVNDALRKLQRAEDAKKAMAEYQASAKAVDANTLRLRALRMEREASEAETVKATAPAPKRKAAAKKTKVATGKLSDWLTEQKGSGRNS